MGNWATTVTEIGVEGDGGRWSVVGGRQRQVRKVVVVSGQRMTETGAEGGGGGRRTTETGVKDGALILYLKLQIPRSHAGTKLVEEHVLLYSHARACIGGARYKLLSLVNLPISRYSSIIVTREVSLTSFLESSIIPQFQRKERDLREWFY